MSEGLNKNKLMLLSNCGVCREKKSGFIMNQEASRLEIH